MRTCRCRGTHVACTRTYSGQGARKKIWPRTYIRAGSRTPTCAYVHGWVGTEKQHRRRFHGEPTGWVGTECVVVFIRRAWTEQAMETRPGIPQNGGNDLVIDRPRSKLDPVHREGCGVPQTRGNGPPMVETGVLLIGRGVAYPKTEETDLLRSKRCHVDREGCGVPQNGGNGPPTVETGSC